MIIFTDRQWPNAGLAVIASGLIALIVAIRADNLLAAAALGLSMILCSWQYVQWQRTRHYYQRLHQLMEERLRQAAYYGTVLPGGYSFTLYRDIAGVGYVWKVSMPEFISTMRVTLRNGRVLIDELYTVIEVRTQGNELLQRRHVQVVPSTTKPLTIFRLLVSVLLSAEPRKMS